MSIIKSVELRISGVGIILYSPFAVSSIRQDEDYLSSQYEEPKDVARQVNAGRLVGLGTGAEGTYVVNVRLGDLPPPKEKAPYQISVGIEIRDRTMYVRDLYDLLCWDPDCPDAQRATLEDGFYHIIASAEEPLAGKWGKDQTIDLYFHKRSAMPKLVWPGVPILCDRYT